MVSLKNSLLLSFFFCISLLNAEPSEALKIKKIYPMGEKIYTQKCSHIHPNDFHSLEELENAIRTKALCNVQNEAHINAVALYLWDVQRVGKDKEQLGEIEVHKDEKCPVCGMYVYKYPKWAAQILYKDARHNSFDGMKDLFKFYFDEPHQETIEMILVRDYYSQKSINAQEAYYVLGSDVYGPMGEELIAFSKEKEAQTFYSDHRGKKILHFKEIKKEDVYKLDE
jgi:nitrous oxide reductase accessory protein NosL